MHYKNETWSEYCKRVVPEGENCTGCVFRVYLCDTQKTNCKLFGLETGNKRLDFCSENKYLRKEKNNGKSTA